MLLLKKVHPSVIPLLTGVLLWASWPVSPLTFLVFIALVPFLWWEQTCTSRRRFFLWAYITMLIWNAATTWWICNSTVPGGIAAILANSLLMCIPLVGFYNVKRRLGERAGYLSLVVFWLTFEYIHLNWQLSWPWLTLGNVFAVQPDWVQWYEYTGTSGGSLWILLANILLFTALKNYNKGTASRHRYAIGFLSLVVLPIVISFIIKPDSGSTALQRANIVVVQPNIDPYEKFEAAGQQQQLELLIRLSETKIDSATEVVVWPETAINSASGIDESRLDKSNFMIPVWEFLQRHPGLTLLSGIEGYGLFSAADKTATAKQISDTDQYYDTYNTAGLLNNSGVLHLYHKSKLVPGVETLPPFLRFIDNWFEAFGGTSGGYASQQERTVLTDPSSVFRFAPAICYESIYGEFLAQYIRKGANVIAIITNDGWWANTSGHKQHMHYARLRAIETKRWIVRSANTGISCFITPAGKVLDPQPWDRAAVIKYNVATEDELTFFAKHGDLLSRVAIGLAAILFLISTYTYLKNRKKASV